MAKLEGARREGRTDVDRPVSALPDRWDELWSEPEPVSLHWSRIRRATHQLSEAVVLDPLNVDTFAPLVGSGHMRAAPVHRWFTYKEGFSPDLLGAVISALDLEGPLRVVDAFGGVGTTALAGQLHSDVIEVRSVEYSPFAHFAGCVKLGWTRLEPSRLRTLMPDALDYSVDYELPVPDLSAFANPKIFHRATVASLLSAREHVRGLAASLPEERDFLLLGLAATVEDLSGAMKDGRALRIKEQRRRRPSSLATRSPPVATAGRVRGALAGQWTAMIEDLEELADQRAGAATTLVEHLSGDARHLDHLELNGVAAFPDAWADLSCFSPPYLNALDYTELYKLELWMLQFITTQEEFKRVREGTLRSHPSVRFSTRPYFEGERGSEIELIKLITGWVTAEGSRREVGPVVRLYFEDMLQVWREQHRVLRKGGVAACVVANSTFSRRDRSQAGAPQERWRLPLLTDVLLAHLALRAGFDAVEIWPARDLRPRNARAACARESLVIARRL